jgi:hypothetical protein
MAEILEPFAFDALYGAFSVRGQITQMHLPIPEQYSHLVAKMRGRYASYDISGNFRRLSWYAHKVARIWHQWLSRRGTTSSSGTHSQQPGSPIATPL